MEINSTNFSTTQSTTTAAEANTPSLGTGNVPVVQEESLEQDTGELGKTPEEKAKANLIEDVKNGNITYYECNFIDNIAGFIMDKKVGNYVVITGIPKDMTLGEIKQKYNLPDYSLKHNINNHGGNLDIYTLITPDGKGSETCQVVIYTSDLTEGLNISEGGLRALIENKE